MSELNDLVGQIENASLRARIEEALKREAGRKKFGLVFEEHLPECTPLYDVKVRRGSLVMRKGGSLKELWRVAGVRDGKAALARESGTAGTTGTTATAGTVPEVPVVSDVPVSGLVAVARFGEPIYPCLMPLGAVARGAATTGTAATTATNATVPEVSVVSDVPSRGRALYKKTKRQMYPKLAGLPMAAGFRANCAFFKLGFLDKTAVSLGRQFREMLPTLWMKAGAHGAPPTATVPEVPVVSDVPFFLFPENRFAVLLEESAFEDFAAALSAAPEIGTVFLVTDYEQGYKSMSRRLKGRKTYQLYRDYLDNFRINKGER